MNVQRSRTTRLGKVTPTVLAAILVVLAAVLALSTVLRISQLASSQPAELITPQAGLLPKMNMARSQTTAKGQAKYGVRATMASSTHVQSGNCQMIPGATGVVVKLPKGTAASTTDPKHGIYLGTIGNFDYVYQFPTSGCRFLMN